MEPSLSIRKATRSDIPAILKLLAQDSFSVPPESGEPCDAHYAAFDAIAAREDQEIVVGTMDGEVIATLQISFIPGLSQQGAWRAQIEAVRVRDDKRNLGIGETMIRWVIARAKERGCRVIQLSTNKARVDAQRFYARLGFKASHLGMKLPL
jgi:N-acetylglutamate synthase-like GNAT family acetyltransferase